MVLDLQDQNQDISGDNLEKSTVTDQQRLWLKSLMLMRSRILRLCAIVLVFPVIVSIFFNEPKGSAISICHHKKSQKLVGIPRRHFIKKEETLLDIARLYDLGYNELQDLYPKWDPWLPPAGVRMDIPSQWILPERLKDGILINTAELRLYFFNEDTGVLKTFPISIGDVASPTPVGDFEIINKLCKPTWTVPPSLQDKYGVKEVPPGPYNPLGEYWLGLDNSRCGIHGTDFPWSIGRMVTRGCIRLYPEDIQLLFNDVQLGTIVKIVYEPVKVSHHLGKVFVEIHRDIYGRIGNMANYVQSKVLDQGVADLVDPKKLQQAVFHKIGTPVDVTRSKFP